MEKRKLILLILGAALVLVGCSQGQTGLSQESGPGLIWNRETPTESSQGLEGRKDVGQPAQESYYGKQDVYFLNYPTFGHDVTDQTIGSDIKAIAEKFLEDAKESPSATAEWPNELFSDYVVYKVGDYYNLEIRFLTTMSHDAHPYQFITTYVLDETFGLIELGDLSKQDLLPLLRAEIGKRSPDWPVEEGLDLTKNFVVTKTGLRFYFDPYIAGPGSDGIVSADIDTKASNELQPQTSEPKVVDLKDLADPVIQDKTKEGSKFLALTFDDGPGAYTSTLLDILKEENAHATFFVLGVQAKGKDDLLRRMSAEGHAIGNHSYNHKQFTTLSDDDVKAQIEKTDQIIGAATGLKTNMLRPPYGSHNEMVRSVSAALGKSIILWNVDTLDWKYKDANRVKNWILSHATDGNIILMHDIHKTSVQGVKLAIKELKAQGYVLVSVPELFKAKGLKPEAGKVYNSANIKAE